MKLYRISLALAVLVLALLACQALTGGGNEVPAAASEPANDQPDQTTAAPTTSNDSNSNDRPTIGADFPMTVDAYNAIDTGNGSLLYYTKMSLEDVMKFYRDEYTAKGYKEREILTVVSSGTFSMVFDGDPSGKAVVIQSVDLGDGSRTVAIRLEDV